MSADLDRELILESFFQESAENVASMERAAVALEKSPGDRALVQQLFRDAHTLKGNALSLGFPALGQVAHGLEDQLDAIREGAQQVTPELVSLLLAGVDELRRLLDDAAAGEQAHTLRIGVDKLDRMLALSGELAAVRSRVRAGRTDAIEELDRLSRELQDEILRARAVPVGTMLQQHARTLRDAAALCGKEARLEVEGGQTELDTAVLELLRDPLTHLVRNAVAHGLESPDAREAAGKPRAGTVALRARAEGGWFVLEVADDGQGFDRDRIAAAARERGRSVEGLTDEELDRLTFEPGFSTAREVTGLSGRGVGLDVVRHNLARLRGAVSVQSRRGEGATLTLRLPLTLAIIDAFFVRAGGDSFGIPLESMLACMDLPAGGGEEGVIDWRGEALPWFSLAPWFRRGEPHAPTRSMVVVEQGGRRAGLAVEHLDGEDQTVLKPLGPLATNAPGVAGSAILGDGRVALILDVDTLLSSAKR
ncbi:MAG TPA: chemotaxis protein CheW [Myxococcales bacterium]|nr:chemotaxis protein CheW [Myxococcales bacterium]